MHLIKKPNFQTDILMFVVGLVGVLGSLSIICTEINLNTRIPTSQGSISLSEKKSQILSTVDSKDFLNREEKDAILKELIGDKIKAYSFSEEQTAQILKALNKN